MSALRAFASQSFPIFSQRICAATHIHASEIPNIAYKARFFVFYAPQDAEPVVTALFDLEHGLPRGSAVAINGKQAPFGALAGIAVYLNGTQLDPEVYAAGDLQGTVDALVEAVGDSGRLWSHWSGPAETALYFYGPDAAVIRGRIEAVAPQQPLLTRCRFVALTPPA